MGIDYKHCLQFAGKKDCSVLTNANAMPCMLVPCRPKLHNARYPSACAVHKNVWLVMLRLSVPSRLSAFFVLSK